MTAWLGVAPELKLKISNAARNQAPKLTQERRPNSSRSPRLAATTEKATATIS